MGDKGSQRQGYGRGSVKPAWSPRRERAVCVSAFVWLGIVSIGRRALGHPRASKNGAKS